MLTTPPNLSINLGINPDITLSNTLPASFYRSEEMLEACKEKIFARAWQLVADTDQIKTPTQIYPFQFLEGSIAEPLLLTRDTEDQIHCLSNVCTHRGNLVAENAGKAKELRCRYHGRRFDLAGNFLAMPEFKEVQNFPQPCDNLAKLEVGIWKDKFVFTALEPAYAFEEAIKEMKTRLFWLPLENFKYDPTRSRDYLIKANWALYCDNYLEGFHIPFVHPALNDMLDYQEYAYETYQYSNLQIGYAKKGGDFIFQIPPESPDYGKEITAYYYWLFPNMMFNFYPWGVSVNIVKPLQTNLTKVSFLTYIWDENKISSQTIPLIDRTEREDEEVVESVQKGVQSRFYQAGRYSPKKEPCVHHFHLLIQKFLNFSS